MVAVVAEAVEAANATNTIMAFPLKAIAPL